MSSETREIIRRETKNIVSSGGGRAGIRSPSYIQVSPFVTVAAVIAVVTVVVAIAFAFAFCIACVRKSPLANIKSMSSGLSARAAGQSSVNDAPPKNPNPMAAS